MPKAYYKHYLLGLLTVVAAFNFLDRHLLSLVLEPIKNDLQLSDSQLGLLTGFAFAAFYALAGIPLARWSDRGNRNTVVWVTTALWSAMVALCGLVGSYSQLLLARIGVAVGEAGCLPPAHSLITDYFDRIERPRAMAIYSMSGPASLLVAFLLGAWVAEHYGWRVAFIALGLPGVLLAVLVRLTLKEPRLQQKGFVGQSQPTIKEVFLILWQQRSLRHMAKAFCIAVFYFTGTATWIPTFLRRSHGMETIELGSWLAFIYGFCGVLGAMLGAYAFSRFLAQRERLQMRVVAVVHVVSGFFYLVVYLVPNQSLVIGFMAAAEFLMAMCTGVIFAVIQGVVDSRMRAIAIALLFMMANLLGLGLGPLAVGLLSDAFSSFAGLHSLRYALLLFLPGMLWVAYHYWRVGDYVEEDLRHNERAISVEINSQSDTGAVALGSR